MPLFQKQQPDTCLFCGESEGVGVFYIVAFEQILVHASIIVNNSKSDNAVNNIPGLNRTYKAHFGTLFLDGFIQ